MPQKEESIRLAHLSDLHFSTVTWDFKQFLCKRWMGNWNLILFRRHYQTEHLNHIPELLETLQIDAVCITGDFATTSLDEEFQFARTFIDEFDRRNLPVHTIPGNHDCYTKGAERTRRFYKFFPSEGLKAERVEKKRLGKGWWWVGLDCALPTPPFCAYGRFFSEQEKALRAALESIPPEENIVLGNHFPLFPSVGNRHDLGNGKALQEIILSFPNIRLYFHGHDHRPYIIDRMEEGFPLVINSGSCAHRPDGTFYVVEASHVRCLVERFYYREEGGAFRWVIDWEKSYEFGPKNSSTIRSAVSK